MLDGEGEVEFRLKLPYKTWWYASAVRQSVEIASQKDAVSEVVTQFI